MSDDDRSLEMMALLVALFYGFVLGLAVMGFIWWLS